MKSSLACEIVQEIYPFIDISSTFFYFVIFDHFVAVSFVFLFFPNILW